MIITLSENVLNKRWAKYLAEQLHIETISSYPLNHFIDNNISKLFIMDVSFDNKLTSFNSAELFAEELMSFKLPKSCDDIYLLMSDIHPQKSLVLFASNLAIHFLEKYNRSINIHLPFQIGYDITLLLPPVRGKWEVYGIQNEDVAKELKNSATNLDSLSKMTNKKLLWQGEDILQYLETPHRTFTGISYAWDLS